MSFWTNDPKKKTCPRCKGRGTTGATKLVCKTCGGKGEVKAHKR